MEEIIFVLIIAILLFFLVKCNTKKSIEGYRDPLYMNRVKYAYDYYPRANGSIYGFPYSQGGSWSIASGYPYYDRVL